VQLPEQPDVPARPITPLVLSGHRQSFRRVPQWAGDSRPLFPPNGQHLWNGLGNPVFSSSMWRTAMPRYYFFCEHEAGVIPDPEGIDLEDEPAALAQAMVAAGEIMRSNSQAGREALVGAVVLVKDNAGATLFRMPFIDPGE
jgi:hypothetical protein